MHHINAKLITIKQTKQKHTQTKQQTHPANNNLTGKEHPQKQVNAQRNQTKSKIKAPQPISKSAKQQS